MLVPIVCFTCGLSLGDLAPIYRLARAKRMEARYGTDESRVAPAQAALDPTQEDNMMVDVLDALRLTKCCRTRMTSAMDFRDYY